MKAFGAVALSVCLAATLLCMSCDNRKAPGLKGQTNAKIVFYGKAVDQDGQPLDGVTFEFLVESFPPDWTYERRGEPLVTSAVSAKSDKLGRLQFTVSAHVLRRVSVDAPPGYRHFYEQYEGTVTGETIPSTYGYLVSSWSDLCYKTDADHPAIFVFVKDGVKEVLALPCRGGYDSGNGNHWVLNKPGWPKKPSLKDVVRKQPATKPE